MSIIVIGIDLAKNIFAVHGVNEQGKPELVKPKVSRDQLLPLTVPAPYAAESFVEERTATYHRLRGLMQRPGIGPITASALLASIGNGHDFKNGRQVAAWIGLTPGQHSSGGKARLGRITKAGDSYLRSLLVMGARSILAGLGDKQDGFSRGAQPGRTTRLLESRGRHCCQECTAGLSGVALRRGFPLKPKRCLKYR